MITNDTFATLYFLSLFYSVLLLIKIKEKVYYETVCWFTWAAVSYTSWVPSLLVAARGHIKCLTHIL